MGHSVWYSSFWRHMKSIVLAGRQLCRNVRISYQGALCIGPLIVGKSTSTCLGWGSPPSICLGFQHIINEAATLLWKIIRYTNNNIHAMILVLRCVAYFVGDSVDRTWCWCVWPVWHGFRTLKGQSSLAKYSLSLGQEIQESKVSHPEVSHGFSFDRFLFAGSEGLWVFTLCLVGLGNQREVLIDGSLSGGRHWGSWCMQASARDTRVLMSVV